MHGLGTLTGTLAFAVVPARDCSADPGAEPAFDSGARLEAVPLDPYGPEGAVERGAAATDAGTRGGGVHQVNPFVATLWPVIPPKGTV